MKLLILSLFLVAGLAPAQSRRTFTGRIADSMCPLADHARMRMGATDAECTIACIDAHGALFVLSDGKDVYNLSDQKTPEKFAGRTVTVTGTLNASTRTIQMESMAPAK